MFENFGCREREGERERERERTLAANLSHGLHIHVYIYAYTYTQTKVLYWDVNFLFLRILAHDAGYLYSFFFIFFMYWDIDFRKCLPMTLGIYIHLFIYLCTGTIDFRKCGYLYSLILFFLCTGTLTFENVGLWCWVALPRLISGFWTPRYVVYGVYQSIIREHINKRRRSDVTDGFWILVYVSDINVRIYIRPREITLIRGGVVTSLRLLVLMWSRVDGYISVHMRSH